MKKIFFSILTAVLAIISFTSVSAKQNTAKDTTKILFYKGSFISIFIERAIYESSSTDFFYNKIMIVNTGEKPVGIDLSNYNKVIYPNQWGLYKSKVRSVIDETQIKPDSLNSKLKKELLDKFVQKKLILIKPHDTLVYYREFNGGSKKQLKLKKDEFIIVSFDGELFATDGKGFEAVYCVDESKIHRELFLTYPLKLLKIKDEKLIIKKK